MDEEETLIHQMGLILTQLRYARRALEDIENSAARYVSFSFAAAFESGGRFGEPPMMNGALKVYVVNINDLTAGGGLGGFFEGLLGGVGRLFGGLLGGLIGGTLGGGALPYNMAQMARIAEAVDRIMARLGGGEGETGEGGMDLATLFSRITESVRAFTGLFQGMTEEPACPPTTEGGQDWLAILRAISDIVDGLILLVPILIGAMASFLYRLDEIRLTIVDLLMFAVRNVLILRGVALVTVFDTIAAVARLGAGILSIFGTTVNRILGSIFRIIERLLVTAREILNFVSRGLRTTFDTLMDWLVNGLGNILIFIGNTRIFRLVFHLVDILPNVLPALYRLIHEEGLPARELGMLRTAARAEVPGPGEIGGALGTIQPFPNIAELLMPEERIERLNSTLTTTRETVVRETRGIFNTAQGAMQQIGQMMDDALTRGEENFSSQLERHLGRVRGHAGELAEALRGAREVAVAPPAAGLEAIAQAYEEWLRGNGMNTLLDRITDYFRTPEAVAPTVQAGAAERPRATVEIEEMIIEVEPPPELASPGPEAAVSLPSILDRLLAELHDRQERGESFSNLEGWGSFARA